MSSLPGHRFAVGSAVNQTARQVGGSLGIALLVVILGTPSTAAGADLVNFRHLWLFATVTADPLWRAVATLLERPPQRVPPLVPAGTPAATYALADRQSI